MKLTHDDIWIGVDINPKFIHLAIRPKDDNNFKIGNKNLFHELMEQILSHQEKAEKYHSLMKANNDIVKQNISHTEIYQENKQLKETIKKSREYFKAMHDPAINEEQHHALELLLEEILDTKKENMD